MRALIIKRNAGLWDDFGLQFAIRRFGGRWCEIEPVLPRWQKGKHAGKIRAAVCWQKVERGGWHREDRYDYGHVELPGIHCVEIRLVPKFGLEPEKGTKIAAINTAGDFEFYRDGIIA